MSSFKDKYTTFTQYNLNYSLNIAFLNHKKWALKSI